MGWGEGEVTCVLQLQVVVDVGGDNGASFMSRRGAGGIAASSHGAMRGRGTKANSTNSIRPRATSCRVRVG